MSQILLTKFHTSVVFHRKCSTLPTLLMTWRVISTWTQATKSAFTWRPTSSKSLHHVCIVLIIPSLPSILYLLLFHFSTGAVSARNIQLVKKKQMRCQGVVCATKVRATDVIK